MKFAKTFAAGVLAAATAAAVSVSASADILFPENPADGLSGGTGMWLVQLYNVGSEAENKPATDYGIDYSDVAQIKVVIKADDPDWMDGNPGGIVIWSVNGGDITEGTELWDKYNWPSSFDFWGVDDPELEFTAAEDKALKAEKIGDYTYQLTADVLDANPLHNGDASEIGCMQTGINYWGTDMTDYTVESLSVLDSSGNVVLEFDGLGNLTSAGGDVAASEEVAEAAETEEAAEETAAEEAAPTETETEAAAEEAPAEETTPAETEAAAEEAPAETEAAVDAATAGDTAAPTVSAKGSPDTGIADVAAIAGIAIVAGGAVIVASRKRK